MLGIRAVQTVRAGLRLPNATRVAYMSQRALIRYVRLVVQWIRQEASDREVRGSSPGQSSIVRFSVSRCIND